jgi:hypothetical protein
MQTKTKLFLLTLMTFFAFSSNIGNFSSTGLAPSMAVAYNSPFSAWEKPDSLPKKDIRDILVITLNWLLTIVGVTALIGFIISGLIYLTSTGNDKKMELAKRSATYCLIGVIVALSSFVILKAITRMLGGFMDF